MAITLIQGDGSESKLPDHGTGHKAAFMGDTQRLTSLLKVYQLRIGRSRRGAFLGAAAILVGAAWIGAALSLLASLDERYVLGVALGATLALPALALLLEAITRPSLAETARILDARMDNQQRLVTALELGERSEPGPLDVTQVGTTAQYLAAADPRLVYPVRLNKSLLAIAVGFLCFALAIIVLKDAGSLVPFRAQALPETAQALASLPTPTLATGLPGSDITPSPTSYSQSQAAANPSPTAGQSDQQTSSSQNRQGDAQSQAADSQSAQSSLDKLGQSLDGQGAAQQAADNLRKGNYAQAAKDIADLGTQSDQLSKAAKEELANALDKAAADPATDPSLGRDEKTAADALRKSEYKDVASSMEELGKSVQDTAGKVMSQQELAKAYPSPTVQTSAPQDNAGQSSPNDPNAQPPQAGKGDKQSSGDKQANSGSPSDGSGQQNQPGQGQGQQDGQQGEQSGKQPDSGSQGKQEGQSAGGGQGQAGQQGGQGQQGKSQGGGEDQGGEGKPGSPGSGHRESGPTGPGSLQGGAQSPFELQGTQPDQANSPSTGDHPALSLDGSGSAGGTSPVASGSASNVPGESSNIPVERWDVIQRYFSGR